VSAARAVDAEVRLYETLFRDEDPTDVPEGVDVMAGLNPDSLTVLESCKLEPALADALPGEALQLERLGYFCADPDGTAERPVLNRTVTLRDTWAKIAKQSA
jgi:glutaminyl-tRNA synthetase